MTETRKAAPQAGSRAERSFAVDRAAVDETARTVELAFSSEAPYERFWGVEILDHTPAAVNLERLASAAPLLVNHDTDDQVGVIESVRIDADRVGRAVVRFGRSARAEEIFRDVLDGIRKNVSVGYMIDDLVLAEKSGDTETYRVTRWTPYEVSLVPVPADFSVGVGRAAEIPSIPKEQHAMTEAVISQPDTAALEARAAETARQAEIRRVNDILTIGQDHDAADLARAAITAGKSVAEFQADVLASKRSGTDGLAFGRGARAKDNLTDDPKLGYRNYGEFCSDVIAISTGKRASDKFNRAASVFGNEASGPDGGYAVPPQFANEIASLAYGESSLLSLADNTPVTGNTMTFPKDETTPWGSTGITATWEAEGSTATPKKPAIGEAQLKLRKLKVLVAASEELIADAPAMSSYLSRKMGEAVEWKLNDAIINGTGAGMPLGILNAACLVAQAKEGTQAADTIVAANVAKMYGRCLMGPGANLVWLLNPDAFQQVITLTIGDQPVWTAPSQGLQSAPNGTLMGRPIVLTDACDTVGDQGDIILANMAGYRAITKSGGAEFAESMHLFFDQDLMAFRLVFRMDGQPALAAAVTPPNSSVTRSHFVALAART